MANVTHLTLTGNNAGDPVCGFPKNEGDAGLHWVYIDRILAKPEHYLPVCQDCKTFVEDESNYE